MKTNRQTLPFKAFYFVVYAALASLLPYLTVYYESLGLSGQQIGTLAAIPPLVTFFSAPLIGAITDVSQRHKVILGTSIVGFSGSVLAIWAVKSFLGLIPVIVLYAFFLAPIFPLIDRSVLNVLGKNRDQYGKQRLWGAVGWGIMGPIAGLLIEQGGLRWAFYGCFFVSLGLLVILKATPIQQIRIKTHFTKTLKGLYSNSDIILFFFIMVIGGLGLSMIHNYLFIYLDGLGTDSVLKGWALTIATISELTVMFFSDKLLRKWKAKWLVASSLLVLALRLVLYALVKSPELALLVQLLHGPTFGLIWVAGVSYVSEITPSGLGNTVQGFFSGIVMGLGSALGAFLGGILYKGIGFSSMYMIAGGVVFLSLLGFVISNRRR
jgi:PPP family 3-phenylpropionic acid transporter